MKKMLVTSAALALVASAVTAAPVYSSNIVGYNKITLSPGFTMVGVPFQAVGGSGTIDIQDLVDTTGLVGFDWTLFAEGDTLQVFNPATQGYDSIYLWSDASSPDPATDNKWLNGDLSVATDDFPVGTAFWIQSAMAAPSQATLTGEVPAAAAGQDIAFDSGFTMVSNPFPYALDINADMTPTGLIGFDWTLFAEGDTLQVFNAATQGYDTIYLWSDASSPDPATDNKWLNGDLSVADVQIPIGGAFWIVTSGTGGTIDFAAP